MDRAEPAGMLRVEVVYSPAPRQTDRTVLSLPRGSTVGEAVAASGVLGRHPGVDAAGVGRWGRRCRRDTVLVEGDRVELYRPLEVDPKESRRRRQRTQIERKRGGKPSR